MAEAAARLCELHIGPAKPDGSYPVDIRVVDEDRRADGTLELPYSAAEIDRALGWMERGLFDADYVREWGAALFTALIAGGVEEVYRGALESSSAPLRLRIVADAPEVVRVPWELLYDPRRGEFLALHGPLVRGVSLPTATRPLEVRPPLRLLVADAFPDGVPEVDHRVETSGIRQALRGLAWRGKVHVDGLTRTTLAGLQDALREARERDEPYHVLHFIGHGQHDAASGRTVLLFETDEHQIDEVDADALVPVLAEYDLKLVFLNACQSVSGSALDVAQGFAPRLLAAGTPAVIGMQVTVLDRVAVSFAQHFYAALADGLPVDRALTDARRLVRGTEQRRKADLGVPVCYLRTPDGRLFEIVPAPRPLWWWVPAPLRSGLGLLATAIGLIASLMGIYLGWREIFPPIPRMTGQFNVAIAEFGEQRGARAVGSDEGRALAEQVYTAVEHEVDELTADGTLAGFDIQVRGPVQAGAVAGNDRAARAATAEKLADRYNIDILVYGNLLRSEDQTSLSPEFFLSDRTLSSAEELVGAHDFGKGLNSGGDVVDNPVAAKELSDALRARAAALTQFVIGLGYYTIDRYPEAAEHFRAAERTGGWAEEDGKEVLYLFLGNVAGKQQQLDEAERRYQEALSLKPEYARAQLGAAEIRFLKARGGDCRAERVDEDGLRAALAEFEAAKQAADQPPSAAVATKAAFGVGRCLMCLSIAGREQRWAEAQAAFELVVAEYERQPNRTTRELASEARANVGLVYWLRPTDDEATRRTNLERAAGEYAAAVALSRHATRQALFHTLRARIWKQLGRPADVDAAIDAAISVDPAKRATYEQLRQELQ